MHFITLADLASTIRTNMYKVPHDVDFVIGIPRSGIIAGSIISEFLNVPLIDIDSFCFGAKPTGGSRLVFYKESGRERKRVLVVDDTMYGGSAMRKAKQKLLPFVYKYEFIYMVVYREGVCEGLDFWLDDVRKYRVDYPFVVYEWNIFHHVGRLMSHCIYDFDGVFCVDPPDERNVQAYQDYIKHATPLFTPTTEIAEIVTNRLVKNEAITKEWLAEHGIKYKNLTMFPAQTWEERAKSGISAAAFKSKIYKERTWAELFVESDDDQAQYIHKATGKPVYCVKTNKFYK